MANTPGKDTVYIDIDEDITGIIDKLRGSSEKIVALVLPKRATVLQSIVNMKLLQRTADDLQKKVVLITSEANLLPLAGAVGLYVAKTLQSVPKIPEPPSTMAEAIETVDTEEAGHDKAVDKSKPVGELAGLPPAAEETIEVDNETDDEAAAITAKTGKNKKIKIPNFEKFRTKVFLLVGGVLALIILWVLAYKVLPKARITITTDSTTINTSVDFTANTAAKTVDESKAILPATQKTYTKTDSEKVATSGQKDKGTKATGTMTLTNCINDGQSHTVPAGSLFSSNNLSFSTNQAVTLEPALFSGSTCKSANYGLSKNVGVTATQGGNQYNLSARSYTSSITGILANGSDMTGGISNMVKVVAQADLDSAKQKMLDRNNEPAKLELLKLAKADNLFAITDSFAVGTPTITSSPNVGDEAGDVTVQMTISYTMLGVKNDDLKKIVEAAIKKHIDTGKQTILSNGLDKAQAQIIDRKSDTDMKVTLQLTAEAGPQLDAAAIKKAVAGKKRGDTVNIIQARPGIKDVKIDYSPLWVGATPTRTSRITVIFQQPNGQPSKQ